MDILGVAPGKGAADIGAGSGPGSPYGRRGALGPAGTVYAVDRVELFCSGGKLQQAYFDPGAGLGPPNRPGFWWQPQMEVIVRITDTHDYHRWNWVRGEVLSMDKGTVRGLIGAKIFKVQVGTESGQEIAEFSPAGLKLDCVKQACGLTPKKPSK